MTHEFIGTAGVYRTGSVLVQARAIVAGMHNPNTIAVCIVADHQEDDPDTGITKNHRWDTGYQHFDLDGDTMAKVEAELTDTFKVLVEEIQKTLPGSLVACLMCLDEIEEMANHILLTAPDGKSKAVN